MGVQCGSIILPNHSRNLTNGGEARRRRGCDKAAIQDKATLSCETTTGGEREIFTIIKVNHGNLVNRSSIDRRSIKNGTLINSMINRSIEERQLDRCDPTRDNESCHTSCTPR